MRTRGERRAIKERKWISKLKKLWNTGFFGSKITPVKQNFKPYDELEEAKTFADFKKDKSGVLLKNTGTIWSDKSLDIQEEHKRNLKNKTLSKEDKEELDDFLEDMNDPYAFEKYCQPCIFFNTDSCPHRDEVLADTKHANIGCDKFYD